MFLSHLPSLPLSPPNPRYKLSTRQIPKLAHPRAIWQTFCRAHTPCTCFTNTSTTITHGRAHTSEAESSAFSISRLEFCGSRWGWAVAAEGLRCFESREVMSRNTGEGGDDMETGCGRGGFVVRSNCWNMIACSNSNEKTKWRCFIGRCIFKIKVWHMHPCYHLAQREAKAQQLQLSTIITSINGWF